MNVIDRICVEQLCSECEEMSPNEVVQFFVQNNLLSQSKCKAYLARKKIRKLIAQGVPTVTSIEMVAEQMACSYETVRKYYYYTYK